jgi:hypothetical protein
MGEKRSRVLLDVLASTFAFVDLTEAVETHQRISILETALQESAAFPRNKV